MPTCIYCLRTKPDDAFEPEHVLPRALCGTGLNWTLRHEVCLSCNGKFSKFEAHWLRQAIEALARNFSGPITRNEKDRFDRAQPMEIDDLYIVNRGDHLVYEAGFGFPSDFQYRPQIIDTLDGLLDVVANETDGVALEKAIERTVRTGKFQITVPMWKKRDGEFLTATVELNPRRRRFQITQWTHESRASGIWLRSYPRESFLLHESMPATQITTRLALDHRRRLYLRSSNIETAVTFFDLFCCPTAPPRPTQHHEPGDQTVAFGISIDKSRVYRAVLKTGFNVFCYCFGADAARHADFQPLRDILLIEKVGEEKALHACRMDDGSDDDFPKSETGDDHRMQIDVTNEGYLRFRLRLFNAIGYYAHLGVVPVELRSSLHPRRIVVAYGAEGMREVNTW